MPRQRIVAVSNKSHNKLIGQALNERWVAETLSLAKLARLRRVRLCTQRLYDNQPTLIFGAVMRNESGAAVGGVGIVFDTKAQLEPCCAMLCRAQNRAKCRPAASALFVDAQMQVIVATSDINRATTVDLPREVLTANGSMGERIVAINGTHYAIGVARRPAIANITAWALHA